MFAFENMQDSFYEKSTLARWGFVVQNVLCKTQNSIKVEVLSYFGFHKIYKFTIYNAVVQRNLHMFYNKNDA